MRKQRLFFQTCNLGWCFRLSVTVFIFSLYPHVYSSSCCTSQTSGPTMFSYCLIQMLHLHYSTLRLILVWMKGDSQWHYLYTVHMYFLSTNWSVAYFKNQCWVSVCISQWKRVSVQLLLDSFFFLYFRFSVKCGVPLSSLRLNLVMINSWSNKRLM